MALFDTLLLISVGVFSYLFLGKELKMGPKYKDRNEMRRVKNYLNRKSKVTHR
jgi:hypothetical protein